MKLFKKKIESESDIEYLLDIISKDELKILLNSILIENKSESLYLFEYDDYSEYHNLDSKSDYYDYEILLNPPHF